MSEWIKVKDQLPEETDVSVIIWVEAYRAGEDDYGRPFEVDVSEACLGCKQRAPDGEYYLQHYADGFADCEYVTHWMPLPGRPV